MDVDPWGLVTGMCIIFYIGYIVGSKYNVVGIVKEVKK